MHFLFALIENALCYLQVGVKKAVHPIRFASDSRIALLAAVSNPPGGDRLPVQAGTILHKVQSVPAAAPFLVSVATNAISDDQKRSVASPSVRAHDGLIKAPTKIRSEAGLRVKKCVRNRGFSRIDL